MRLSLLLQGIAPAIASLRVQRTLCTRLAAARNSSRPWPAWDFARGKLRPSAWGKSACVVQAFGVEPPGWAKYVQLRLLTHYGSEPVCALNDVRVYGKSAAEDLEDRLAMEVQALSEANCANPLLVQSVDLSNPAKDVSLACCRE